jgi:hypothetical protein
MNTLSNKTGVVAMRKSKGLVAFFLLLMGAILSLAAITPESRADRDNNGDEIPFEEAKIFLELNNTDGDLGIHALVDGEAWKKLTIEDPNERTILVVTGKGRLGRHGLTELCFESDEPPFDELPPEEFLRRFPEGKYEFGGKTLEGDELESTAELTHVMPAPPANILISGISAAENCDADPLPEVGEPIIIEWDPVTLSHPEIGTPNSSPKIKIVGYQVVVEREAPPSLKFTFDLPPDETMIELPVGFFASGDELKLEVLAREESGNQTAVETCFEVD